jgi:hypothetical protein
VLLFDPDDVSSASSAEAAAAATASSTNASGVTVSSPATAAPAAEDIGRADLDVLTLLARAAGKGGSSNGSSAVYMPSGAELGAASAAAAAAVWEGWIKLDKVRDSVDM